MADVVPLVPDVPSAGTYRADYYFFRQFLMGLAPFNDGRVIRPQAMKLIFGVNRPFRIRLEQQWYSCRAALLKGNTPHFLSGQNDWQVVLWIEPGCALQLLLDVRTLDGRSWILHKAPVTGLRQDVIQTVIDEPDAPGALHLAEALLRVYGGIQPVPALWDDCIKDALSRIDRNPAAAESADLAREFGREEADFLSDFQRVVGMSPDVYIHRRRLARFFSLRTEGVERNEALEQAALSGWDGLKDSFWERYALNLEVMDTFKPYIRLFSGEDAQAALYL